MPGFLSPRRLRLFALLFALSLGQLGAGLAVAHNVGVIFEQFDDRQAPRLAAIALLLLLAVPVFVAEVGRRRTTEALGLDYARAVRLALFERMLLRSPDGQRERSRGGQLLPFVGDLSALRLWWSDGLARGSSAALIAAGVCIWLAMMNWQLGTAVLALFVTILLLLLASLPAFARAVRSQRQRRGALVALISDRVAMPGTVSLLGGLRRELNLATRHNRRMDAASQRRAGWSGLIRGLAGVFSIAAVAIVLALAGELGMASHQVVEVITITGLLATALADLVRSMELAIPARIARKKIAARFAELVPPAILDGKARPIRPNALLELHGFALAANAQRFDTKLRRGDVVAVEASANESLRALFCTLAGMALPAEGEVLLDGRLTLSLPQKRRREMIGIAAPWLPLLRCDAVANAAYRLRGPQPESVAPLANELQVGHLITRNPQVNGAEAALPRTDLAGLSLVRALAGAPDLLLLDHPDRDLTYEQLQALARIVSNWKGVVIFASGSAALQDLATRHWHIAGGSLTEVAPGPGPRLAYSTEG